MRKRVACIAVLAASLSLMTAAQPVGGPPEDARDPREVTAGDRPPQVDVRLPDRFQGDRCVAHPLNTYGQALYISGTELYLSGTELYISGSKGGMIVGPIEYIDPDGNTKTIEPDSVGKVIEKAGRPAVRPFLYDHELVSDVMIVVADDFGHGVYRLPPDLRGPNLTGVDTDLIESLAAAGDLTHGALIMNHLNLAIASTGRFVPEPPPAITDHRIVWRDPLYGGRLVVVGVNLADVAGGPLITTEHVLQALIERVQAELKDQSHGTDPRGVVINMSWVFLPCQTVQDFIDAIGDYPTFEDYLRGVGVDVDRQPILDVIAALASVPSGDMLAAYLDSGERIDYGVEHSAYVAASGNFSLPYQMLPAGWSQVVGVAVEEVKDRPFPGRYSSVGDVTVPGEWVTFQPVEFDLQADSPSFGIDGLTDISYAGTSYAAPLVSLYVALDMASVDPQCLHQPSAVPELTATGKLDVRLVEAIDACP